jgi:tRNA (pseudouridine54-N1)-methyltransferase
VRQFVVLGHDAPTTPEFSLDDLPGTGRLDVLCRCVTAAFVLSHAIREDVRAWLVLADEFTVRFEGSELRHLQPDERSTAALVREALERRGEAIGHEAVESTPGISLSRRGFEAVLEAIAGEEAGGGAVEAGTILALQEDATPVIEREPPADPAFVLADHREFTARERRLLAEHADARVRLGPEALHADHAIAVAHNWLDTGGFARY